MSWCSPCVVLLYLCVVYCVYWNVFTCGDGDGSGWFWMSLAMTNQTKEMLLIKGVKGVKGLRGGCVAHPSPCMARTTSNSASGSSNPWFTWPVSSMRRL